MKVEKEKIMQMIDDEIVAALKRMAAGNFDVYKSEKEKEKNEKESELSDDDIDRYFFHGGEDKISDKDHKKIVAESVIPKINNSDIEKFKNDFKNNMEGATVNIDMQKNGKVISFPKTSKGIDAYASGDVDFGKGQKLYFTFSLINGVKIDSREFSIDDTNKQSLEKLENYFSLWETEWRRNISTT